MSTTPSEKGPTGLKKKSRINSKNQVTIPAGILRASGLQAGDEVLSINGVKVTDWYNDVKVIRNSGGKTLSLEIKRGSQILSIVATPTLEKVDGKPRWILGIINKVGLKRTNPITAFKSSALVTRDFISASVKSLGQLPSKIPSLWGQSVGGEKRSSDCDC